MSSLKVLITGGSGLLGQFLNKELANHFNILTTCNQHTGNCEIFNSSKIDLTNFDLLTKLFESFNPNVVVHAAAISNPNAAMQLPAKDVYAINVKVTEHLAKLCEKLSVKLIYLSTDLVYAGYRGSMLKEDAKLIPISLYAETKLLGEIKIKNLFNNYLILRTALLYGFSATHATNHFQEMHERLKSGKSVSLFTDQYRTPLALHDAARIIREIIQKDLKTETLNFGGLERVSRFELGEIVCDTAKLDKNLLQKISLNDLPNYPAVADVSMNTDRLQSFGIKQQTIEEAIIHIMKYGTHK
ncbi:MAG: NAD(P)-dependent oxidoreductase [Ignavibacteria bacterium CG_4_8_14_3_um_filter_37_9]|nr:NAD(P)-dependent oxidoreductase [Ignavibacteria bacterium]OIO17036.1 MAG: NAD(P)-dependent oxidoreductase [Ignavibacteria bacterium CG1_02_37_35]PIS46033.1 MAG: NAD(P)-dependent oxidoreductase [Ignavibacteria bacterium CG08_land_8_20_14_0_20_37_9]PIW98035.1 MAG: NAD(P)-dependent oxidoreductase [Ignavibacteria bacterium CG_4_8_14_3_um_filter_37_9]PIX94595.1 MAG: NAD(P)-dependent oxidoreductase [Ignavibacteria bacterium CG_4_10_14_3_um_filter_37_18]PJC60310.1 MAG: NAD(P)-dependent oxidoreduct